MNSCPTCGKELLPEETCTILTIEVKTEKITLDELHKLLRNWGYRETGDKAGVGDTWLDKRSQSPDVHIFWNNVTRHYGDIILEFDSATSTVKVWADETISPDNQHWFSAGDLTSLKDRLKGRL